MNALIPTLTLALTLTASNLRADELNGIEYPPLTHDALGRHLNLPASELHRWCMEKYVGNSRNFDLYLECNRYVLGFMEAVMLLQSTKDILPRLCPPPRSGDNETDIAIDALVKLWNASPHLPRDFRAAALVASAMACKVAR
jgi:hypothetical protein